MKTSQQWINDYLAGRGERPHDLPEVVHPAKRGKLYCAKWNEHEAARVIRQMEALGKISVTLPSVAAGEVESVTPRHIKPLLPEMKSGNVCGCCGKAFETARRHAATCSAACRKRKSRGQCK